ncbi:DUF6011 domain-containing protein [Shouchella clausii]|uniref:DUF6011 domain-containing protein n=1 Tax=Shouchella clausii TaxID=79880 RepID=UPI000BA78CCA|nr:DUF6011 domain-containing protein [Shouchella clausii]PAD17384.1 hypothetical protein CHH74_01800 [Shouchella clausii]
MIQEVMHTHCKRCSRPLRGKESMLRGYGPVCAKKVKYGQQLDLVDMLDKQQPLAASEQNFMDELEERRKVV